MANWLKEWYWREVGSNLREWVSEAPIVVKVLFLITLILVIWLPLIGYVIEPERAIRGTGVALQFLGFVVVAYGLETTLEKFQRVPLTAEIMPWVKEFPDIFDTAGKENQTGSGQAAHASAEAPPGRSKIESEPPSLEKRLEQIEENIDDLKADIKEVRSHMDKQYKELEKLMEERLEEREEDVQELRDTLEKLNVGEVTLGMEWVGVSLLIYGLLLSASPSLFQPAATVLAIPVVILTLVYLLNRHL